MTVCELRATLVTLSDATSRVSVGSTVTVLDHCPLEILAEVTSEPTPQETDALPVVVTLNVAVMGSAEGVGLASVGVGLAPAVGGVSVDVLSALAAVTSLVLAAAPHPVRSISPTTTTSNFFIQIAFLCSPCHKWSRAWLIAHLSGSPTMAWPGG